MRGPARCTYPRKALPGVAAADQVRTISEAANKVTPGDRVIIHGGTYRETVVVEASGTSHQAHRL